MNLYKRCENMIEKNGAMEQCDTSCYGAIVDQRIFEYMTEYTVNFTCPKCGYTWVETIRD